MTSNILITFLLSLLTLSGINTSNTSQAITDTTVVNESAEVATGDTDYEEDDEVNDETDDEIADEDLMSIEEKYEHNKRNYSGDSGDTLVWYDVPYCDNHDFEVIGDETETMYICKKCGYSYSEFHKNAESEDNTDSDEDENGSDEDADSDEDENGSNEDADSDEDENGSNEEQESDDEDTCNE